MSSFTSFRDALLHDDALVCVIRGHFHIEAELNRFIENSLPHPGWIKFSGFTWDMRIGFATGLGLSEELRESLKKLGDIRNHFARHPDAAEITEQDVDELFATFTGNARKRVLSYLGHLKDAGGLEDGEWKNRPVKTRFALTVLALHNAVEKAADSATPSHSPP